MCWLSRTKLRSIFYQISRFTQFGKLCHSSAIVEGKKTNAYVWRQIVWFQLLGELLLDRYNFSVMTKYISNPDNLKQQMNLLKEKSKNIQFEAFHVFKVELLLILLENSLTFSSCRYLWLIQLNPKPLRIFFYVIERN